MYKMAFAAFGGSMTAVLVGFMLLQHPLVEPVAASSSWQGRLYCETRSKVTGSHALNACPTGYHMANMAEIVDPSALKYDGTVGFQAADSGSGPPFGEEGWVRTGLASWGPGPTSGGGVANCSLWTTDSPEESGTVVELAPGWGSNTGSINSGAMQNNIFTPSIIAPWRTRSVARTGSSENIPPSLCSQAYRVWCVQD